jgi:hypothetical protein
MPRLMQAIAAAAMVSFCASCATVTRGTTEQIQIVSDPPGPRHARPWGLSA